MVNPEPCIQIRSLSVGYAGSTDRLVASFSGFSFDGGDMIAVVGKNGAGKSTLLRTIGGLQPPVAGAALVEGKPVHLSEPAWLARCVSMVLTERVGGFNLRVEDLVENGQMPYTDAFHRMRPENKQVAREAMLRCGVFEYRHRPVSELSDGMLQKAMIARALAQQTPVLLLDEPTAFLDYAARTDLFIFLREEAARGKCILVSTHELDLALRYCTGVLIVHDGTGALVPVAEAKTDPRLQAIAGGHLR